MNYITEIFQRANLHQLQSFLLTGSDTLEAEPEKTYKKQVEEKMDAAVNLISELPIEQEKQMEIIEAVFDTVAAAEEVYAEIGIRCGAMLITQLLMNPKTE